MNNSTLVEKTLNAHKQNQTVTKFAVSKFRYCYKIFSIKEHYEFKFI